MYAHSGETPQPEQLETAQILEDVLRPVEVSEFSAIHNQYLFAEDSSFVEDMHAGWMNRELFDETHRMNRHKFSFPRNLVSGAAFVDLNPDSFDDFDDFLTTARQELQLRYEQKRHFDRLLDYVDRAYVAEDVVAITETYIALRTNAKENERVKPRSYASFLGKFFERYGSLIADPADGMADPEVIADFMLPAVRTFLDSAAMAERHTDPEGYKRGIGHFLSQQLFNQLSPGTAEYVAGLRLRAQLNSLGYEGFRVTKAAKAQLHRTGNHYITTGTLRAFINDEIAPSIGLPEGTKALEVTSNIVRTVLDDLAKDPRYPVATQINGAYEKLSLHSISGTAITPYRATFTIANAMTTELNKRPMFADENKLPKLDDNALENLPLAFQRILFAIDEALLKEATIGNVQDGSKLRKQMVYLEALATQWHDHSVMRPFVVGDVIMRLYVMGYRGPALNKAIVNALHRASLENVSANGDDTAATEHYRDVITDPRTRAKHVKSRKRRGGYGVIS